MSSKEVNRFQMNREMATSLQITILNALLYRLIRSLIRLPIRLRAQSLCDHNRRSWHHYKAKFGGEGRANMANELVICDHQHKIILFFDRTRSIQELLE